MKETVFVRLVAEFVDALKDGRIDGNEGAKILKLLAQLIPAEDLFRRAGRAIADALYRDPRELRRAARRKRKRAADRRAEGRVKKAKQLIEDAETLEELADEREAEEREAEARDAPRRKLKPKAKIRTADLSDAE